MQVRRAADQVRSFEVLAWITQGWQLSLPNLSKWLLKGMQRTAQQTAHAHVSVAAVLIKASGLGDVLNLFAIRRDQIVEGIDFSVDEFKRTLAYVILLTMRYVLAYYYRFIKLTAIGATPIIVSQYVAIVSTR
jgi:hypothetical protein